MMEITRRDFVRTSAIGGLAAGADPAEAFGRAPAIRQASTRPVIISSANGHEFKNGGPLTCVEHAFKLMTSGTDVLDALVAGVNIVEFDPEETSVGYGGLPNADGVVQLDACCMHGAKKRAGGVAGARRRAYSGECREGRHGDDGPSLDRRGRRADVRAQHGVHD